MFKSKQIPQNTVWRPFALVSAFFYPVSKAEVSATIAASQEERRLAREAIKDSDALSQQIAEELQKSAETSEQPKPC